MAKATLGVKTKVRRCTRGSWPVVTSRNNCDVTSSPVVMRRYINDDGDKQRYKTSKTQVSPAFYEIVILVE